MKSLILIVLALLVPGVAAQDACDAGSPCEWVVQVDDTGLSAPGGPLSGTVGDWYVFEFNNLDGDSDHLVTWSLDGSSWNVGSIESLRTDPFQLTQEGTYELVDENTNDTLAVQIQLDDVADGDAGDGEDTPAAGLVPLLVALGAVLWLRRR